MNFPKLGISFPLCSRKSEIWETLTKALNRRSGGYAIALNPEKVMKAAEDADLLSMIQQATIPYADGIGIVLAGKRFALPAIERYPGIDLFTDTLAYLDHQKGSLFLFGAKLHALDRAIQEIKKNYPNIRILGCCPGYDFNRAELCSQIEAAQPHLVAVALGSPAQEHWIRTHAPLFPGIFFMGVGGSFDVLSGTVKRAPKILRLLGLEWLYRLLLQPTRIRRQFNLYRFLTSL